jgi:lipopolysaccharide export system protein LptA
MSRVYLIFRVSLAVLTLLLITSAASFSDDYEERQIVVTSDSLEVDSQRNTALFTGSVVAKVDSVAIHSDKMRVSYSPAENIVQEIHAIGNVRVLNQGKAIFSEEAKYVRDEEKILLTGNPKVVEGQNTITGTRITYFFREDRAIIDDSKVTLKDIRSNE